MKTEQCRTTGLAAAQLFFLLVSLLSPVLYAQPQFAFERVTPALQAQRYLDGINMAVGDDGTVYFGTNNIPTQIVRFSRNGQVISKWSGYGIAGMDVTRDGELVVNDSFQILRYTAEGELIFSWPYAGTQNEFGQIDVSENGNIFALDLETQWVHVYDPAGSLLAQWNTTHTFADAISVVDDAAGDPIIFVLGTEGLLEFDQDGVLLDSHTLSIFANAMAAIDTNQIVAATDVLTLIDLTTGVHTPIYTFDLGLGGPWKLTIGADGSVYAFFLTGAVLNITLAGESIFYWRAFGDEPGRFLRPGSLAIAPGGTIYVSSPALTTYGWRIQKLTDAGFSLASISTFSAPRPPKLAVGPSGALYMTEPSLLDSSVNLVVLDSDLSETRRWTTADVSPGSISSPIAVGPDSTLPALERVYVAVTESSRIDKYSSDGNLLLSWGTPGSGTGQFAAGFPLPFTPAGISDLAVSPTGEVMVLDSGNDRIEVFDGNGNHLRTVPIGFSPNTGARMALMSDGSIILSRQQGGANEVWRIDQSGQILATIGQGYRAGLGAWIEASDVAAFEDGRFAMVDRRLHRMQSFKPVADLHKTKAIILAGGGAFPGNALWVATRVNANFAFRALSFQGFTKESIHYLSADIDIDLDSNGLTDDVDGDATVANLQDAIVGEFAEDAEELVIYMVDHGGTDNFLVSHSETLSSQSLDTWLDSWQAAHPGSRITFIYDACQSGTFLDDISGSDRTIITSAQGLENAYFVSQGALSFSNHFWSHIFNGLELDDAFSLAQQTTTAAFPAQHPILDADGNGIPNEPLDFSFVDGTYIGNGTVVFGQAPVIESVSPPSTIPGSTATITANNVTDDDGVNRVWALIRPPGFQPLSGDSAVSGLPSINLIKVVDTDNFSALFSGFIEVGTYSITVYAVDSLGNAAVPKITSVTVESPLERRAVLVVGGQRNDPGFSQFEVNSEFAYQALIQQGYDSNDPACMSNDCDAILYLTDGGTPGFDQEPSRLNIESAITTWGTTGTQDLTLYFVGDFTGGNFRISDSEVFSAAELNSWMNQAAALLPGKLAIVLEGDQAGTFVPIIAATGDQSRIVVASTDGQQSAAFLLGGNITFSHYFWINVLNGSSVFGAYKTASDTIRVFQSGQTPVIEDTGDGSPNGLLDGLTANQYTIGNGTLIAGTAPFVGQVTVPAILLGADIAQVSVGDIITTGAIVQAIAVVISPSGAESEFALAPANVRRRSQAAVRGAPSGIGYSGTISGLGQELGTYSVFVFAIDDEGNVSAPGSSTFEQEGDPLIFRNGFEET